MKRAIRLQELSESCWYRRSWLSVLLLPFSWVFALLAAGRREAYARGVFRIYRTGVPVIVVGNITAGGTGKTPVVAWLAQRLCERGYRPGIVSRGYGGSAVARASMVVAGSDASMCGDEPVLLARLTGCPVAVGADRVAAVKMLEAAGVDMVIADDGLQHYRLHRDVEIAVVDGLRQFGNGWRLPAGPLRESLKRLQSVDAVLINGAEGDYGDRFDLQIDTAVALDGSTSRSLQEFSGHEVWCVAGIGNPARFRSALQERGIRTRMVSVPDHGTVSLEGLAGRQALPILMTEKDAVKYAQSTVADTWYVPATVHMSADAQANIGAKVIDRFAARTQQA